MKLYKMNKLTIKYLIIIALLILVAIFSLLLVTYTKLDDRVSYSDTTVSITGTIIGYDYKDGFTYIDIDTLIGCDIKIPGYIELKIGSTYEIVYYKWCNVYFIDGSLQVLPATKLVLVK